VLKISVKKKWPEKSRAPVSFLPLVPRRSATSVVHLLSSFHVWELESGSRLSAETLSVFLYCTGMPFITLTFSMLESAFTSNKIIIYLKASEDEIMKLTDGLGYFKMFFSPNVCFEFLEKLALTITIIQVGPCPGESAFFDRHL
jgi:hypothetical protein